MDILKERYELSMERIREIREECDGQNPPCGEQAAGYFKEQAELLLYLDEVRGALLQEAQSGLPVPGDFTGTKQAFICWDFRKGL